MNSNLVPNERRNIDTKITRTQKRFGKRIRELRTAQGYTLETLADKAGIHWTYLGGIERGIRNPSLKNIEKIAKALKVPINELFLFNK